MNAPEDASPTVAIVGTGQIGAVHVECARRAGATVVGLVGSSPDRAQAKATAWGVPVVYSGLEELLEQPDIDVVHIASPNHVHGSQAIAVANAGKHVICEKPMALDSTSAGAMSKGCADGNVHSTSMVVSSSHGSITRKPVAPAGRSRGGAPNGACATCRESSNVAWKVSANRQCGRSEAIEGRRWGWGGAPPFATGRQRAIERQRD